MDPLGVLANEYVRRLNGAQFLEPPAQRHRDGHARDDHGVPAGVLSRWRRAVRAFQRVATALLD
jgi:hypothetical protein